MPNGRYEAEAEKILAQVHASKPNSQSQSLRIIVEALENAERHGRETSARLKESSG